MVDSRKYIIGGNWKSNGSVNFVRETCTEVLNSMKFDQAKVEVVVAPVFIHIASAKAMLNGTVSVAAQNCSANKNGAFTGEVSAEQIKDFGVNWVIVGHSERRTLFAETNEMVAQKVTRAQEAGLHTILCIGETLAERDEGRMNDVLKEQLSAVKEAVIDWSRIVIAYEPVWAIGTGLVCGSDAANETHGFLRTVLARMYDEEVAQATRIQYGGSVTPDSVDELMSMPEIDGCLVGGASLDAEKFGRIINYKHSE